MAGHEVQLWVFVAVFGLVTVLGFAAARWRRPTVAQDLEQWGLGGRAFGNFVTWFLLSGELYTAYTFVALPALVYGIGAFGFFAVPFAVITIPIAYLFVVRLWSVSHVHGFVTPAEFVRARFGSRSLSLLVAITGIAATMPYVALQLLGLEAVLKVMGVDGPWPMTLAFLVLALYTFKSGLRAPALISIVKDILILWTVFAAIILVVATHGAWRTVFKDAAATFAATPSTADGLILLPGGHLGYLSIVVGSALGLFLYPHAQTGVLAARNRGTIKRNLAALPVYTLVLGLMALLGFVALSAGVKPVDGDRNTIIPAFFDQIFPAWCAGLAFAAIGVAALVPAAVMSIAAANLFTRGIYREFLRPNASAAEETLVSKTASLAVKAGAILAILFLSPQFSIDLQLIGGVIVLQILPAVAIGLWTSWPHRGALAAGLICGLGAGVVLLYQIPQLGQGGAVVRAHFGGSSWPLAKLGFDTRQTVYAGILALLVNLTIVLSGTLILRATGVRAGVDRTRPRDYLADEGDESFRRMPGLVDGTSRTGRHVQRT